MRALGNMNVRLSWKEICSRIPEFWYRSEKEQNDIILALEELLVSGDIIIDATNSLRPVYMKKNMMISESKI